MRAISLSLLALSLHACSTEPVTAPREYLDEHTAATITVVKDPWIFTRESVGLANSRQRDFLQLYAIDVNRMGEHRQYIAALCPSPPVEAAVASVSPILELKSGGWSMRLEASTAQPKDIGIVQPIAESYELDANWFYFPVDKQTLATIANAPALDAELISDGRRDAYTLWRDGREELSELTAVLP